MKKIFLIIISFFIFNNLQAGYGTGDLTLTDQSVYNFQQYLEGKKGKPMRYLISVDGKYSYWWYCPYPDCEAGGDTVEAKMCAQRARVECATFAVGREVKWRNGINPGGKAARFGSKDTINEIRDKLAALGFYGNTQNSNNISRTGKRSLAMNWVGYKNLIVGEIEFKEKNNVGSLKLQLPNNDGKCEGTYALSTTQGTWSLLCSNKMSASGNLVLNSTDGSVTGEGKDTKGNKVEFTIQAE